MCSNDDDLVLQLRGRAQFLQDIGEVKSVGLMQRAADVIESNQRSRAAIEAALPDSPDTSGNVPKVPDGWRELMREARDNCEASLAETDISAFRREYRLELLARLDAALSAAPEPAQAEQPKAFFSYIDITMSEEESATLRGTLGEGDQSSPVRLQIGNGHGGYGLYASSAEYPEEGAVRICDVVLPTAQAEQPRNEPVQQEPVAQWQKRHPLRTEGRWENTNEHDAKWWRDNSQGWEIRVLYTSPQAQPMSDEQSIAICKEVHGAGYMPSDLKTVRAVERFHKIGG
jgi:hypothetical protein